MEQKPDFKNISENISRKIVEKCYEKIKSRVAWSPDVEGFNSFDLDKELQDKLKEDVEKEIQLEIERELEDMYGIQGGFWKKSK